MIQPVHNNQAVKNRVVSKDRLIVRCLVDVKPKAVDWLWKNRLAAGRLNVINGDPDVGKTFTVLDIAARITTGRDFPDGAPAQQGGILFVTAEDGIADTILPRLHNLGADLKHAHVLDLVQVNGKQVSLSLDSHIGIVEEWLAEHPHVRLLIFDPLSAFLGSIDVYRNNEVRAVLGQLSALAEKLKVTVIGIDHLTKASGKAIHRGLGSIAFTAAPRTVWQVLKDPQDLQRRLFLPVKMNLAKTDGLAFHITDTGVVQWSEERITKGVDEMSDEVSETPRAEAKTWLRSLLENGPCAATDIKRLSAQDGICFRTLEYAKKEMGIVSRRDNTMWVWAWPDQIKNTGIIKPKAVTS